MTLQLIWLYITILKVDYVERVTRQEIEVLDQHKENDIK